MQGEPIIPYMCDVCEHETDFGLTALAGGGWDARNVKCEMERDGWLIEGDRHVCPDCREEQDDQE
jgi:hypothetical protein